VIDLLSPEALPFLGLYAETHYRFPLFPFSRYFRREPEIIFDAPHRLQPGLPLPVTLIIKDANHFPIELEEVVLTGHSTDGATISTRFPINRPMECTFWYAIYDFDLQSLAPGWVEIDCSLIFKNRGRRRVIRNDNHVGLSHAPLKVFHAEDPLPLFPGWQAGELHCHTSYGPDYVEFGAPLEAIQRTSQAIGLSWAALTDHSYNLDDLQDDYLRQDPELIKWQLLQEEALRLSQNGSVTLLPGEELTVRNSQGRNVHLIILGNKDFLHGSGDGAEEWLRTRSEWSISEALKQISPEAFAVAAHPLVPTPPLEWLLVGRGEWHEDDLSLPRLDGWQIANGSWGVDFERGYELWKTKLRSGRIVPIFAGNDAHGNFNRFRQVRLPMLKLWEHDRNLFGKFRTLVKTDARKPAEILQALKHSPVVISDGPALELLHEGNSAVVRWKTTPEFGTVQSLSVIEGLDGTEINVAHGFSSTNLASADGEFQFRTKGRYVRAELQSTTKAGQHFRALAIASNPEIASAS